MSVNSVKRAHAAIGTVLVTVSVLRCGSDPSMAADTDASASGTSEREPPEACDVVGVASPTGLRSTRPECGIYFVAASDGRADIRRAVELRGAHLEDALLTTWLRDIATELGDTTPFFIAVAPALTPAGVRAWNYFDIGRPIDLGRFEFDSEFQETVRDLYPDHSVPGILYGPRAADTTFRNEVFERLAGATFIASGLGLPFEEHCGFQSFTWAADRVPPTLRWTRPPSTARSIAYPPSTATPASSTRCTSGSRRSRDPTVRRETPWSGLSESVSRRAARRAVTRASGCSGRPRATTPSTVPFIDVAGRDTSDGADSPSGEKIPGSRTVRR